MGVEDVQHQKRDNQMRAMMKYDANAKAAGEVYTIDGVSSEVEEQPCCELEIGGLKILSLVDTGAAVSLIKREIVDKLPRGAIACSKPADSIRLCATQAEIQLA